MTETTQSTSYGKRDSSDIYNVELKETIVPSDNEPDEAKNEECYAELIQLLDDKSLSLVMRDAGGDGRRRYRFYETTTQAKVNLE